MTDKKVNLDLTKVNGNGFAIIGAFKDQARREGWSEDEIKEVTNEAVVSDYDHLLQTIMAHCE